MRVCVLCVFICGRGGDMCDRVCALGVCSNVSIYEMLSTPGRQVSDGNTEHARTAESTELSPLVRHILRHILIIMTYLTTYYDISDMSCHTTYPTCPTCPSGAEGRWFCQGMSYCLPTYPTYPTYLRCPTCPTSHTHNTLTDPPPILLFQDPTYRICTGI